MQPNTELLWKQYEQNNELYKFYMDLVIKLNVFYYAVTGAILSFYFANNEIQNAKYSLVLPIVMSFAFAMLFIYGAVLNRFTRQEQFRIRDALGLLVAVDVGVLSVLLGIFAAVFVIVGLGCLYMLCAF